MSTLPLKKLNLAGVPIHIGTSGYYFKDWIGHFYPEGTKPEQMLDYYAQQFPVVEINMTYILLRYISEVSKITLGMWVKEGLPNITECLLTAR